MIISFPLEDVRTWKVSGVHFRVPDLPEFEPLVRLLIGLGLQTVQSALLLLAEFIKFHHRHSSQ
jgi:hypothetical protein